MKKIDWLIIVFIIFVSFFTLKDLFKQGFYTSHDGIHQVVRFYYFDQAIRDGQIPPRFAGGLLNGFGYPLFIFSYHLPWLIAEPLHLAGLSIIDSVKMAFLLGFIFSGISMYLFQREMFNRLAAFVGTVLYLFAPYRFSNIFVRAAIGDATAFIFPPILFLSLYKLKKRTSSFCWRWICLGALAMSGLLLSHAMIFLFFFISIILYIIYSLLWVKNKLKFIFSSIVLIFLGFGLSSYYLIPSATEKKLTVFSYLFKSIFSGTSFVDIKRLLYSSWGYGVVEAKEGAMSLQLGITQWLVILISTIMILFIVVLRKKSSEKNNIITKETVFYSLLFFCSIIMMLPISSFVWKAIERFIIIDFTWRILVLSVFCVSILAGFIVHKIKYSWWVGMLLIILAFYANRNHIRINQSLDWPLSFYLELERTTNSYDEYTPIRVRSELVKEKKPKVEFSSPDALISINKQASNILNFDINTNNSGKAKINTIYYPGWQVKVNNLPVDIDYQSSGFMEFPIKKGSSKVTAQLKETPLRLFSDMLTLLSISFVSLLLLKYRK